MKLSTKQHDRDNAGLTYVYPVVSRRAQGVSVGINLNTNNACNYRCVYCQVPGLTFGNAPAIDLALLEKELRGFMQDAVAGDWMETCVPEGSRVLRDIAISGNGEPTSSEAFPDVLRLVGRVLAEFGLLGQLEIVLITNGSLVQKPYVQEGLALMGEMNGRVWFKLDSATEEGLAKINSFQGGIERLRTNLHTAAPLCPTWIQTCMLDWDGPPSDEERGAYLNFLRGEVERETPLLGVLLYGLARKSYQPEAPELKALPVEWLKSFADEIRALGLEVRVSA